MMAVLSSHVSDHPSSLDPRAKVSELTTELSELKQKAREAEESDPTTAISAVSETPQSSSKPCVQGGL